MPASHAPSRPLPDAPQGPCLAIVRGPRRGTILPILLRDTLVGRIDSNHLVVEDPSVSRLHARLTLTPHGVLVEDLGSRAGTFVNGRRIQLPTLLADGDEVVLGQVAFVFSTASVPGHHAA